MIAPVGGVAGGCGLVVVLVLVLVNGDDDDRPAVMPAVIFVEVDAAVEEAVPVVEEAAPSSWKPKPPPKKASSPMPGPSHGWCRTAA